MGQSSASCEGRRVGSWSAECLRLSDCTLRSGGRTVRLMSKALHCVLIRAKKFLPVAVNWLVRSLASGRNGRQGSPRAQRPRASGANISELDLLGRAARGNRILIPSGIRWTLSAVAMYSLSMLVRKYRHDARTARQRLRILSMVRLLVWIPCLWDVYSRDRVPARYVRIASKELRSMAGTSGRNVICRLL